MKVYDLYYITDKPKFFRGGLTEEQMDKFWNSLSFWQKSQIQIKERDTDKCEDLDR